MEDINRILAEENKYAIMVGNKPHKATKFSIDRIKDVSKVLADESGLSEELFGGALDFYSNCVYIEPQCALYVIIHALRLSEPTEDI